MVKYSKERCQHVFGAMTCSHLTFDAGRASPAHKLKEAANEAFKRADYPAAVAGYTHAIQQEPSNPVYYNNRAAALLKVDAG